jgi:diaminopimelate decarboxylase
MKANDRLGILRKLRSEGLGVDVVSGGEISRALRAGFEGRDMVFSGVGKVEEDIEYAVKEGLGRVNVESFEEMEVWSFYGKRYGREVELSFRYTPDIEAGGHEKIKTGRTGDKFGLSGAEVERAWGEALLLDCVKPVGLAVHLGSQIVDVAPYTEAAERVIALSGILGGRGYEVRSVDIGGGFGIDYGGGGVFDLSTLVEVVRRLRSALGEDLEVGIEPGRSLVGDAGLLVGCVRAVKHEGRLLVLDAGMHNLLRPALYDSYHHMVPLEKGEGRVERRDVVGPICESGDILGKGRWLREMVSGEFVGLCHAGAYGSVLSSGYNARGCAGEVIISGGQVKSLLRRRTGMESEGFGDEE